MKLDALAAYLEDKMPQLAFGKNLFVNQMPSGKNMAVLLKSTEPGAEIDGEAPSQRSGRFQLFIKGDDYAVLKALADDISEAFTLYNKALPEIIIKAMRPLNEVQVKLFSNGSSCELCTNFFIKYAII